ncbi:MAG: D-alanine--D-alanine ligase [Alphaproteobacteria bacterium]|nr:D-alanine--D-alanine ligase [Alphaproteobacteria bacterium]
MTRRVAVLMGGVSAEREVSLNSGQQCAAALREAGHTVDEIDVTSDIKALLAALDPAPDVAFNALHGRYGEDGCIQGLLNLLNIPYTHSGVLASALAMDKFAARTVFEAQKIGMADAVIATPADVQAGEVMPPPYVVKPINEGSSVGVHIVRDGDDRPPLDDDPDTPRQLLVERYIPGRELTVAVMGAATEQARALAVTELRPVSGFYNYEAKYTDGKTDHLIPAPVSSDVYDLAMSWAATAHQALGCRGVSRSDLRYDDDADELVMLEVNTQPGMTRLSLVPEQAAHTGIPFTELVDWLVETAKCD